MKIIFNGKALFRNVTGIERYTRQILFEINKKISFHKFAIAVPRALDEKLSSCLKNFDVIELHGENMVLWEQIILARYAMANNLTVISLDFSNPLFLDGISTIHDMSFKTNKNFFDKSMKQIMTRIKLNIYSWNAVHSKFPIVTVSEFQKNEIIKYYKINENRVKVIGNGWQHFEEVIEDRTVLDEFGLMHKKFFFSLSSNTRNKNFEWIYKTAEVNSNSLFVIAGGKTSISVEDLINKANIIYIGYQSDERVKALYKNCRAFIFPSLYEGFGIPPLEALSVGADIIVSNTTCLPEIYGDTAYYIDPYNPNVNLQQLLTDKIPDKAYDILNKYSWENAADAWIKLVTEISSN